MQAIEMIKGRRSIRKYKDQIVTREDINNIMEATRFTQSWGNTQVARFTFVQNEEIIKKLAHDGVKGFIYNVGTLKTAKNVMVLSFVQGKSGKLEPDSYATNKENEWEIFDAGIACQTFALAAHANGVGTCVMGIIDDKAIAEIIGLPSDQTVAALVTFGYPDEEVLDTKRLSVEELTTFIK